MNDLPQLHDGWRAADRAARSDDYAQWRAGYEQRLAAFDMVIRSRWRAILRGSR